MTLAHGKIVKQSQICAVFALYVSVTARACRYAATGSFDTSDELGMPKPPRGGGGGALRGTTFGLVA